MRRRNVWWVTVGAIGCVVAVVAGYVLWQYRTAALPALDGFPVYTSEVPLAAVAEPQRTDSERQLRELVAGVQPGYRIAEERILATDTEFIWDALRHQIEHYLRPTGHELDRNGWSADHNITFSLFQPNGALRRYFNDDLLVAAGFVKVPVPMSTGGKAFVYGYFRITRN